MTRLVKTKSSLPTKFAFFDFAATICPGYFIGPFNVFFAKNYLPNRYPDVLTEYHELGKLGKEKKLTYNQITDQITLTLASLLQNQQLETVVAAGKLFAAPYRQQVFAYVTPVFNYLHEQNFQTYILTADFDFIIGPVLDVLPQTFQLVCSQLAIVDRKFTGKIKSLHNHDFKARTIAEIEHKQPSALTIAFGDSDGDIPMLNAADLGFLIKPNLEYFHERPNHERIVIIEEPNSPAAVTQIINAIEGC